MINLIVQYYKVTKSSNVDVRQSEIDHVLKLNCMNKYIDIIHLLLEDDYNLDFLNEEQLMKIKKIIINKRLTYYDAFNYYNKNLSNKIAMLANADIYFDNSLYILQYVNWMSNLIIAPTRYECCKNIQSNILYGTFQDLSRTSPWLNAYEESVYTQDVWMWCTDKIDIKKSLCDFYLGMVGCNNYIANIFIKNNYTIISSSKYICANHYDHLSINNMNIKGNESFIREHRIGSFSNYSFISSGNQFIDKYIKSIQNYKKDIEGLGSQIEYVKLENTISTLSDKLLDFQYTCSSYTDNNKACCAKLNSHTYWEPKTDDPIKEITVKYNHLIEIPYIDIQGLPYMIGAYYENSYVTELEIYSSNDGFIFDKVLGKFTNDVSNYDYIKRFYFENHIICTALKIKIIKYHIKPSMRLEIYYITQNNIYNICKNTENFRNFIFNCNYIDTNRHLLEFDKLYNIQFINAYYSNMLNHTTKFNYISTNKIYNEFFTHNKINADDFWIKFKNYLFDDNFKLSKNILQEDIKPGICLFTYIMNRKQNLEKNIITWLNKDVDQIIILDWSSTENYYDIIEKINDKRIMYVRVNGENTFIRTYAQNLAAKFCKYDKILKLDSDVSITENFFEINKLNIGEFIVGNLKCARDDNEKYTHGNIYLYLDDFFKIGGYNELIKTYGYDDSDFSFRLQLLGGLNEKMLDLDTLYHNPHTNDVRKKNMNGVYNIYVETYKHKYYMDKIPLWNRFFKHNNFLIVKKNNNYVECKRITDNLYNFSNYINTCENNAINLIYSWYSKQNGQNINNVEYKKKILADV